MKHATPGPQPTHQLFVLVSTCPATCCPGHPEIDALNEFANRSAMPDAGTEMARSYTDGSGRARVTGGKDLKMSQSYPAGCLGFLLSSSFLDS